MPTPAWLAAARREKMRERQSKQAKAAKAGAYFADLLKQKRLAREQAKK